jgi:hypothetical protein
MRRAQSNAFTNETPLVDPTDTIVSLFGKEEDRNFSQLRDDPRFKMFRDKLKAIQTEGTSNGACEGEVLLMIIRGYWSKSGKKNLQWDTIPYGEMDDVKEFIKNNIDRRREIIK